VRALSASELLSVWERCIAQRPEARALALLSVACDDIPVAELARLAIGARDAQLLELRERTFGSHFAAIAECPACRHALEVSFETADIRVSSQSQGPQSLIVERDGYVAKIRLPNSLDLAEVAAGVGREPRRRLFELCVLEAHRGEHAIEAVDLPESLANHAAEVMAERDPQATIELAMNCPQCSHGWNALFDVVTFFWGEIQAWSIRMLRDVHELASAYGWREADIFALSPARRQTYLDLMRA
jgi:hypothetical protein